MVTDSRKPFEFNHINMMDIVLNLVISFDFVGEQPEVFCHKMRFAE